MSEVKLYARHPSGYLVPCWPDKLHRKFLVASCGDLSVNVPIVVVGEGQAAAGMLKKVASWGYWRAGISKEVPA